MTGKRINVGGWTVPQAANDEIQALIEQVKEAVQEQENFPLAPYRAISFKSQLVAGTNYIVKVKVNTDGYIHLAIFQPLPGNGQPQLENIQNGCTVDDEI